VQAFFFPAYQSIIPQITPPDMLTSANSLNGLSGRITGIVGPSIGAALVVAGGTSLTFALDGLSFFISALFVFPLLRGNGIETQSREKAAETQGRPKSMKEAFQQGIVDLREGFHVIIAVPWIWVTILIYGFVNMAEASPRAVAMPFLIKNDLGADVSLLGIFGSTFSAGFIVGALLLGQFKRLHRRGLLAYMTTLTQGVLLLFFGFKFPIPVLIASMFVYGFSFSVFGLIWNNTLQEMVPHEMLGRVYSIDGLGSFVLMPIGFALAGWATDLIGAPTVFLIGGFSTIALALIGLSHPRFVTWIEHEHSFVFSLPHSRLSLRLIAVFDLGHALCQECRCAQRRFWSCDHNEHDPTGGLWLGCVSVDPGYCQRLCPNFSCIACSAR